MKLSKGWIILIVVVGVILLLVGWATGINNNLVTKEEGVNTAWANVENVYQRRLDLIPNLVNTVKGVAKFEQQTLTAVIEARAKATSVQINPKNLDEGSLQKFQEAQNGVSSALGRLMVVVEKYPELKATQNFSELQAQLEGTENRITIARRDYNEAVRDYNTTLRTFPNVIWAKTVHGGSQPMQLFTATAEAQSAPQVNFNLNGAPAAAPGGNAAAVAPGSTPPAQ